MYFWKIFLGSGALVKLWRFFLSAGVCEVAEASTLQRRHPFGPHDLLGSIYRFGWDGPRLRGGVANTVICGWCEGASTDLKIMEKV